MALAGKLPSGNRSARTLERVGPLRGSAMNVVVVTISLRLPPANLRVFSIKAKIVRTCASKSPLISLPLRSVMAVSPDNQMVQPPSVTTAGE